MQSELENNTKFIEYGYQKGIMDTYKVIKDIAEDISAQDENSLELDGTIKIAKAICTKIENSSARSNEIMSELVEQLKTYENV